MDDLNELTVNELLAKLHADSARNRRIEAEARDEAERAERAITALEQTVLVETAAANGSEPRGEAAVIRVLSEDSDRLWRAAEVHSVLEERGWISPEVKHPRAGTDAALNRLVRKGVLSRRADGHYYIGAAAQD